MYILLIIPVALIILLLGSLIKEFNKNKGWTVVKTFKSQGDIVVWSGDEPTIGRVKRDFDCTNGRELNWGTYRVSIDKFSNFCHYEYVRLATDEEIKLLDDKIYIKLK